MNSDPSPARTGGSPKSWKIIPLAADYRTVWESPDPMSIYLGSPSVETWGERIIATFDLFGPGAREVDGPKGDRPWPVQTMQGKVMTSDDGGKTWNHRTDFPFMHARVFKAGGRLYVLGHCGDIKIMTSDDGGTTWSAVSTLTHDGDWTQAPANVWYANGNVYLVMMKITTRDYRGYFISVLSPVLLRAREQSDLMRAESWAFSSPWTSFRDLVSAHRSWTTAASPFIPPTGTAACPMKAAGWMPSAGMRPMWCRSWTRIMSGMTPMASPFISWPGVRTTGPTMPPWPR